LFNGLRQKEAGLKRLSEWWGLSLEPGDCGPQGFDDVATNCSSSKAQPQREVLHGRRQTKKHGIPFLFAAVATHRAIDAAKSPKL
jgi:hypothetical protein